MPDSSWFTNRIGREPWTVDRLVKGPDTGAGPSGTWTIVSGKLEGVAPGFTIRDKTGQLYFIKFDPPSNPEMASGAEVISTKLFHAFGYHVPENYLATVRRETLVIGEGAIIDDDNGRRRQMDPRISMRCSIGAPAAPTAAPGARQQGARGQARRAIPLLRHAAG